jgi:hypothetical protein
MLGSWDVDYPCLYKYWESLCISWCTLPCILFVVEVNIHSHQTYFCNSNTLYLYLEGMLVCFQ